MFLDSPRCFVEFNSFSPFISLDRNLERSQSGNGQRYVRFWAGRVDSELVFGLESHGAVSSHWDLGTSLSEVGQYPKGTVGTACWVGVSRLGEEMQTETRRQSFKFTERRPPKCGTLTDTGPPGTHVSFGGREEQNFSTFEYLLEFLNKENYDLNFTSWLRFDQGDASTSTAPSSCPAPGTSPLPGPPLDLKTLFRSLPN